MKKFDDGGGVYPHMKVSIIDEKGLRYGNQHEHPGITRRNECADKIAAGIQANPEMSQMTPDQVANLAYIQADALIAEGKK